MTEVLCELLRLNRAVSTELIGKENITKEWKTNQLGVGFPVIII